jgi:outer membrane protein assembly factor BamB
MSDSTGLAASWPAAGPRKLWSRALGEGHSSIVVENGRIYTLYRQVTRAPERTTHEEVVAAFDAATGQTVWEFKYPAPTTGIDFSEGLGPHSTPLIVGDRVFAASSRSEIFALDKATGKRIWSHDLIKEYKAVPRPAGMRSVC